MNNIQAVRRGFSYFRTSPKKSITLKEEYYWLVKIGGMLGVAIEIDQGQQVNESFSKINYYTKSYIIDGEEYNLLLLVSDNSYFQDEFVYICAAFLEKVLDSKEHQEIQRNPIYWWHAMKDLLGNANIENATYSVIAELISYYHLLSKGEDVQWTGPFGGTVDLVCASGKSFEVKSTIARYGSQITINSQYQLRSDYLLFYRFEPSVNGISIQIVLDKLLNLDVDPQFLEQALAKLKYPEGSEVRNKTYSLLEAKLYRVDENFPKITPESFVDGQLPNHIIGLQYTLDLGGLESERIEIDNF